MGRCPAEDRESSAGLVNGARENVEHTGHLTWATAGFLDRPLHGEDGAHCSRSVLGGEAKVAHDSVSDHFSPVVTLPLPLQVVGALPALHLHLLPERYAVDFASERSRPRHSRSRSRQPPSTEAGGRKQETGND